MKRTYKKFLSVFLMIVLLNSTVVYPVAVQGDNIVRSEKNKGRKISKTKKKNKKSKDTIDSKSNKESVNEKEDSQKGKSNNNINKDNYKKNQSIKKDDSGKKSHNNKGNKEKNNSNGKVQEKSKSNKDNIKTDRFIVKYKANIKSKKQIKKEKVNKSYRSFSMEFSPYVEGISDDIKQKDTLEEALKGNINKSKKLKKKDYELIVTNSKVSYKDLETLVSADESIEYIIPDYKVKLTSNDTYYKEQWGLQYIYNNYNQLDILNSTTSSALIINSTTGSSLVTSNLSISSSMDMINSTTSSALDIINSTTNSALDLNNINIQGEGVIIGVIDSGIDVQHEDLSQNIWINENEILNGIDDDNNGYIDDIYGWNFLNNSNNIFNEYNVHSEKHGTHIAGIISAIAGNGKGVAGAAPKAKILPLKAFENEEAYTSDIIEAIEYAKSKNVKIMNCSWGNEHDNPVLRQVIEESGMLFIFSAGNKGENIDRKPFYPASYDSENILTVGSINQDEERAARSNYGQVSVDVFAPGENIISTLPNNQYGYMSGTSMATAFATAEAALLLGEYKDIDTSQLKNAIIKGSISVPTLPEGRVINNIEALKYLKENPLKDKLEQLKLINDIIAKYNKISEFTEEDLKLILEFYDIGLETILRCEERGHNPRESIDITILVENYDFSIEEIEKVMNLYGNYNHSAYELFRLSISKEILGLTEAEYRVFRKFFLSGYKRTDIESAFIVSNAIDIPMEEIIIYNNGVNQQDTIKTVIDNYTEEERKIIDDLLRSYNVNFIKLLDFSKEEGYSIKELQEKILNYHKARVKENDKKYSLQYDVEEFEIEYEKYFNSPFSINSGSNESISPNSGMLTYEKNILSLPGINGLDLNINAGYSTSDSNLSDMDYLPILGVYKQTVQRFKDKDGKLVDVKIGEQELETIFLLHEMADAKIYARKLEDKSVFGEDMEFQVYSLVTTCVQNSQPRNNFIEKHNRLGSGWSLGFSSIEIDKDRNVEYLCLSNGSKYIINLWSGREYSNLVDYTLRDLKIEVDYGTFSNGEKSSSYVLTYKNGNREYFASDGRLLGIKDIYDNTIKFYHKEIAGYNLINKIVDTLGREINITYDESTSLNRKVVFSLPDKNTVQLISEKIHGTSNQYVMKEIIDQEGRSTKFDYSIDTGKFSFAHRFNVEGENKFATLRSIMHPTGATTSYEYEKVLGNMGYKGYSEYYRMVSRKDIENGKESNVQEYNYEGNYTGYGEHDDSSKLPDSFTYKTSITNSGGIKTTYTFNNKHLPVKVEVKENKKLISESNTEFDSNKQPLKVINKTYDKENNDFIKNVKNYQYDRSDYGDVIGYWGVQAHRNSEDMPINDEHKTTFEYNTTYHYITSKTYKKDKDTIIKEKYIPNKDNKNIEFAEVYENNVLKSKTNFVYDSYGNIIEDRKYYKDEGGNWTKYIATKYSYDDNDQIRINSDKPFNGAYLTKQWVEGVNDVEGNSIGNIEQEYKYDYLGNIIEKTDGEKNKITCEYDILGRITKEINPDKSSRIYKYNDITNSVLFTDEEGHNFSAKYDSFGNIKSLIDVQNVVYNKTTSEKYKNNGPFTATGRVIKECNYDLNMKLVEEKVYNENESNKGRITTYTYYNEGRVKIKEIKDFEGTLLYYESYIYDDADPQGKYSSITKVVKGDAISPNITTKTYIDKVGNGVIAERNHQGKVYKDTFTYDYLGNKIQEKIARAYDENWTDSYTAKFDYDFAGRLIRQYNIEGNYSSTEYDELGRVKSTTDMSGNSAKEKYSTIFEYDKLGRVIKEKVPFAREDKTVHYAIKKYLYDRNGNLKEQQIKRNKIGEAEDYNKVTYEYNTRNMLTKVTTYDNGSTENYTQYFYDKLGNKLRMYTGLSQPLTINGLDKLIENGDSEYSVTKYEYDKYSNLSKRITPSNKQETYDKYNNTGKLLQKTDRNKNIIKIKYDGLNRIQTRTVTTPTGEGNTSVTYTYTTTGQIKTMTSDGITTEYIYDDLGRLKTQKDSTGIKKEYTYDAANNRKSFTLSINNKVKSKITYEYDKQNRLKRVFKSNNGTQEETAAYTYDNNGNRNTLQYPNGITVKYNYNLLNLLTELTNKKGTKELSRYTYTYYLDGNKEKEIETREGQATRTRKFNYDGLGRLETETQEGKDPVQYDYDDRNNRSEKKAPFDLQNLPNNIEEVSYKYNGLNQLTNAQIGGITSSYKYDGNGLRRSKTVNGKTIKHILDGQNIIAETDESNNIIAEYIRGINLIAVEKNNKKIFYLFNGHGDVVQLTDEKGSVIKNYKYDAFGNELSINQNDANPFRYGGEYFDSETGLYYLRARYYDPKIGRFTTEDSYWGKDSDALSLNLYTYAWNNPIMYVDPSGHDIRNTQNTIYSLTPKEGIKYINHLVQSNKTTSKVGEILTYADLALATLDVTTLGLTGHINMIINSEIAFVADSYNNLKSMFLTGLIETDLRWSEFNEQYRLEITHIAYEEKMLNDLGGKMAYIYGETSKGRNISELSKDEGYSYHWESRSLTISRFISVSGDYLKDSDDNYVQYELFKGPTIRGDKLIGRDFLENITSNSINVNNTLIITEF